MACQVQEMLHVEVEMAFASNRPVLVFVQRGTDVGRFMPQLVQYIVIDPSDREDVRVQWPLIANYFRSSLIMIEQRWREEKREEQLKPVVEERLRFIRAAQASGLSPDDVRTLLEFQDGHISPCGDMRAQLDLRLKDVDQQLRHLPHIQRTLKDIAGPASRWGGRSPARCSRTWLVGLEANAAAELDLQPGFKV